MILYIHYAACCCASCRSVLCTEVALWSICCCGGVIAMHKRIVFVYRKEEYREDSYFK
jgi:hypothetical protein